MRDYVNYQDQGFLACLEVIKKPTSNESNKGIINSKISVYSNDGMAKIKIPYFACSVLHDFLDLLICL